jgi:TonB-linked SusC/RagA family outer membrane protein
MYKNYTRFFCAPPGRINKYFLIMKLTVVLLIVGLLQVSAATLAQKVTFVHKKTSFGQIIRELRRQTNYNVLVSANKAKNIVPKDVNFKDATITEVLETFLKDQPLNFEIQNGLILIKEKPVENKVSETPPIQVAGTVVDEKGIHMPGVNIRVKNTQNGVVTDQAGKFTLNVPDTETILVFSFIGYQTREFAAGQVPQTVAMVPEVTDLSAVVVVGYGSQKKVDVTGAVSSVTSKDFNQGAIINPLNQIQGKVAGLVITQKGGDPNDQGAAISLRGQTSILGDQRPLFVIDGIAIASASQFQNLSPSDIESYDVLKDVSATAIYGSRGANGVILVTTKKGKGNKTQVDYDGYAGFEKQAKYWDLLSPEQYLTAIRNIPNVNVPTYDKGARTDWQKAVSRTAVVYSNNLGFSGGSNNFTYRASLNYQNQQGIIINSGKRQLGIRFNAQQKALNDKLEISLNASSTTVYRNQLTDGNAINLYMFNSPPTYPVYNPDGTYFAFTDYQQANPVMHLLDSYNKETTKQTLINTTANYKVLQGLTVGLTGVLIQDNTLTHTFTPTFPLEGNINTAGQNSYNQNTIESNAHINFDRSFGKHNIAATTVYEYNEFNNESFNAAGQNYLVPSILDNNLGSGDQTKNTIGSGKSQYKIISVLARINYNYDSRFYLTASVRRDGSDKFGADHQWGTFPSVNLAYRLKRDLLKNVSWVDDVKLRLGYGIVGNGNGIGPYNAITLYSAQARYYDASNPSYPLPNSYSYGQNPNPDLRWEERRGKNIGLDFSLFNYRLTGDINYFDDKTVHMLYNYSVPTPPFFVNTILANVGDMTNKGLEVSLSGIPIKNDNFNWTVNGQLTIVRTNVLNLSGTYNGFNVNTDQIGTATVSGRGLNSVPVSYIKPGQPLNVYFLPHYTGIDAAGNQLFDGKTIAQNPAPAKYYVNPNPDFSYGLNNSFTYKNVDLSFFIRGVHGHKLYNQVLLNYETITRLPGANTTNTAVSNGIKDAPFISDRWLEAASFLRLDNLALGYTFKKISGVKNLRFYVAGNNLFVITKYRGLDPEIAGNFLDGNSYPKNRTIVFGTTISFQ